MEREDGSPETAYNVGGESSSTSNTIHSTPPWKYEVFLSFAGKDTRLSFTDHLYNALTGGGIKAFRDNEGIKRGEFISNQVFQQAIKGSLCAVVVLSPNYAESKWCLEELEMILECSREFQRTVFPIFYDVGASDVKNQREKYGPYLDEHEKKLGRDRVKKWRKALTDIGSIAGCPNRGRPESELIKVMVGIVSTHLSTVLPSCDDKLFGIEPRVREIETLLEIRSDDKRVVGIWGMGGVGKTTLARVVYKKISYNFEVCCFIANVRDTLQKEGLVSLQEKLLSEIKRNKKICNRYEGEEKIRKYLSNKKVLLVLDDVDNKSQLDNLAENPNWFGKGSRILITTRDSSLLTFRGQRMYDMKIMDKAEAVKLFQKKAFEQDSPEEDCLDLSNSFVEYAGCLPLALKVLGSYLHRRKSAEWREALDILKQFPNNNIVQVLQISYQGLNAEEKTIFLDIACFFRGWPKKEVIQILKSCDLHPTIGIKVLIEKGLLVEAEGCKLEMHDLIQQLGRDIVNQESPEVCKRSRLWKFKDIREVLENDKGCQAIQAIAIEDNYEEQGKIKVHWRAFSKMSSIRLLFLKDTKTDSPLILPTGFKLPGTLKAVQWPSFPFKALPLETSLNELVHVKMHHTIINQLGNLTQPMKIKFIDLSYSECKETPNFLGVPHLKYLCLHSCKCLDMVDPSLEELKELVVVDLHGCSNLKSLPTILKTNSLIKLDLGGCKKVGKLPKFEESLKKLSYLDVSGTTITELPSGALTGLRYLNLSGCEISNLDKSSLKEMPLTELYLSGCGLNDSSIPDDFGSASSLIVLDLSYNHFVKLPTGWFSSLSNLRFLSLDFYQELESLEESRLPPRLIRLITPNRGSDGLSNLVPSLDHEYRGQTEYVISDEEYDDTPSMLERIEALILSFGVTSV